jgi:hypothetical protein
MLVWDVSAFREATMCKSLIVAMLCLAFAFANSAQVAARTGIGGNVPLTKEQVAIVCGDKSYCEKPCGLKRRIYVRVWLRIKGLLGQLYELSSADWPDQAWPHSSRSYNRSDEGALRNIR